MLIDIFHIKILFKFYKPSIWLRSLFNNKLVDKEINTDISYHNNNVSFILKTINFIHKILNNNFSSDNLKLINIKIQNFSFSILDHILVMSSNSEKLNIMTTYKQKIESDQETYLDPENNEVLSTVGSIQYDWSNVDIDLEGDDKEFDDMIEASNNKDTDNNIVIEFDDDKIDNLGNRFTLLYKIQFLYTQVDYLDIYNLIENEKIKNPKLIEYDKNLILNIISTIHDWSKNMDIMFSLFNHRDLQRLFFNLLYIYSIDDFDINSFQVHSDGIFEVLINYTISSNKFKFYEIKNRLFSDLLKNDNYSYNIRSFLSKIRNLDDHNKLTVNEICKFHKKDINEKELLRSKIEKQIIKNNSLDLYSLLLGVNLGYSISFNHEQQRFIHQLNDILMTHKKNNAYLLEQNSNNIKSLESIITQVNNFSKSLNEGKSQFDIILNRLAKCEVQMRDMLNPSINYQHPTFPEELIKTCNRTYPHPGTYYDGEVQITIIGNKVISITSTSPQLQGVVKFVIKQEPELQMKILSKDLNDFRLQFNSGGYMTKLQSALDKNAIKLLTRELLQKVKNKNTPWIPKE